ncbi:RHS repeat-associated core domain-containing protein, partial [Hazenella sp. IB182353]|uniref:RHS repeat-associated core domain-containing protein n=1 Tax=Polycladospora coralii TaxID=2771432 RepID=UPI001BD180C7
ALFTGVDSDPTKAMYNPYRYSGKRWDPNTESYDLGFRNYFPGTGRFMSPDSYTNAKEHVGLFMNAMTNSLYAYTDGNPISYIDPDGHLPLEVGSDPYSEAYSNPLKVFKKANGNVGYGATIPATSSLRSKPPKTHRVHRKNGTGSSGSFVVVKPVYTKTSLSVWDQIGDFSVGFTNRLIGNLSLGLFNLDDYYTPEGEAYYWGALTADSGAMVAGAIGAAIGTTATGALVASGVGIVATPVTVGFAAYSGSVGINGAANLSRDAESLLMKSSNRPSNSGGTLPQQGTVKGNIKNAPPVDAGKQGKHVLGHKNNTPKKTPWPKGETGVNLTQEAWMKGTPIGHTRVWDAGRVVGTRGETGVRVHIDGKGNVHGYPVNPSQYLK